MPLSILWQGMRYLMPFIIFVVPYFKFLGGGHVINMPPTKKIIGLTIYPFLV